MISEQIFRAYDIRGIYGKDLTKDVALRIGKAIAAYLGGEGKELVVGRDIRLSGKTLEDALIEGLTSGGCNVEEVGIVTTPILYFATKDYRKDGGVMVSASHNPPEWNGFKMLTDKGFIYEGEGGGMEELKKIATTGQFKSTPKGKLRKNMHVLSDYENYILKRIHVERRLRGVLDVGNGSCSLLVPGLYESAGIDVLSLNAKPDGSFPAHAPEPTPEVLGDLAKVVLREKADFGAGFDGDGDRCVFVDEKGRVISGNAILIILAKHYLEAHKGAPVIFEVGCSMSVEEAIRANGGKPLINRVGHTYITERMLKEKAVLGGETSGHFYYSELHGFDDATYTSLKIAEILSKQNKTLSEIVDSIPSYPTFSKNYDCPDEKKFKVVESLREDFEKKGYQVYAIDGVKVSDKDGWFLIRPSNTQPLIRMAVEGRTEKNLEKLLKLAEGKLLEKISSSL